MTSDVRTVKHSNSNGKMAEDAIGAVLSFARCRFERQARAGRTIYGTDWFVDFLVTNFAEFSRGLIIESKWQDRHGTIDEKFPYLLSNIQCNELPAIIILSGGGCRRGGIDWLRARCSPDRLVSVFSLEEFMSWLRRNVTIT